MLDGSICTSHADILSGVRDQNAWKGEVTWDVYEETGFIIRTFVTSSGYCRFRLGAELRSGLEINKIERIAFIFCVHLKFYAILDMGLMTR